MKGGKQKKRRKEKRDAVKPVFALESVAAALCPSLV